MSTRDTDTPLKRRISAQSDGPTSISEEAATKEDETNDSENVVIETSEDDLALAVASLSTVIATETSISAISVGTDEDSDAVLPSRAAESVADVEIEDVVSEGIARQIAPEMEEGSREWASQERHFFVLSISGKPIYSLYGDESKLSGFMGSLLALISVLGDAGDSMEAICCGPCRVVFWVNESLILVAISNRGDSAKTLRREMEYMYNQIVMVLTGGFQKLIARSPKYDLRGLMGGMDKALDTLAFSMRSLPHYLVNAVPCLPLSASNRAEVGKSLLLAKDTDAMFVFLCCHGKLISLGRPKKRSISSSDLLLLMNFVESSSSFQASSECWSPICFPEFNAKGYLYSLVSYISPHCYLLLSSADKDAFFRVATIKKAMVSDMQSRGVLDPLETAAAAPEFVATDLGLPHLRHFLYVNTELQQYVSPGWSAPYMDISEQKRILHLYARMEESAESESASSVCRVSASESFMLSRKPGYWLFVTLSPFVSKRQSVTICHRILRWIKAREGELFVTSSPTW